MKIEELSTTLINIANFPVTEVCAGMPPDIHRDSSIRLDERVTLIRGNNGSGKTVIAEALSLLGHSPIIPFKEDFSLGGSPLVNIKVSFSENDVKFLVMLSNFISNSAENSLIIGSKKFQIDELGLRSIIKTYTDLGILGNIPQADKSFVVEFWKTQEDFDLKKILANDHLLAKHIRLRAFGDLDEDFGIAVRWLIAWNRPKLVGSKSEIGPWDQTPRYVLDQSESIQEAAVNAAYPTHPPGPVGYFNTDMYDFGAGLDIRESPKEMRSHMTTALVDRLQLVSAIGTIDTGLLSKKIEKSGQTFPIRNIESISLKWAKLFSDPSGEMRSAQPLKTSFVQSVSGKLNWGKSERSQEFMSSGENQAFFALCYIENFQTIDSFLILDEPELHLSIKAASALIEDIVNIAHKLNTQVIIVTHLPHLFYQAIVDNDMYKLIYLDRVFGGEDSVNVLEGKKAFVASSRDSHVQVDHLVENLRSVQSPSIWFWRAKIFNVLSRAKIFLLDHPRFLALSMTVLMMGGIACIF